MRYNQAAGANGGLDMPVQRILASAALAGIAFFAGSALAAPILDGQASNPHLVLLTPQPRQGPAICPHFVRMRWGSQHVR